MANETNSPQKPDNKDMPQKVQRRTFLSAGIGTMAALATTAGVLEPLRSLKDGPTMSEFLQQHYTRLTPDMMDQILHRIERQIEHDYGAKVHVGDYKPLDGVEYSYALNLSRCNGSRRCVYACMHENNVPLTTPKWPTSG